MRSIWLSFHAEFAIRVDSQAGSMKLWPPLSTPGGSEIDPGQQPSLIASGEETGEAGNREIGLDEPS